MDNKIPYTYKVLKKLADYISNNELHFQFKKYHDNFKWINFIYISFYLEKFLVWIFTEGTGARYIYHKIIPPIENNKLNKRPPATIFWWLTVTYFAFYGIASSRYESKVDQIENKSSVVISLINTDAKKK